MLSTSTKSSWTPGARSYSAKVEEYFYNSRNIGAFEKVDDSIGTATVGKAQCGDVIKLQVKIKDDRIQDVKFKAFGCGSAIASSAYASELIKGKTIEDALKIKNSDISNDLMLPPIKFHCSLLAEDAVKLAIKDYRKKQEKKKLECQSPTNACAV